MATTMTRGEVAVGKKGIGPAKDFAKSARTSPTSRRCQARPAVGAAAHRQALWADPRHRQEDAVVIDVQDGYDAEFIRPRRAERPAYIQAQHKVARSVELVSKSLIEEYAAAPSRPSHMTRWNRGLPTARRRPRGAGGARDQGRVRLIVFTTDYLDARSPTRTAGVFALDGTPWSDAKKPVALVGYDKCLTTTAGAPGPT